MDFDITNPIFQDTEKARRHLEHVRWPDGPVCPHCGVFGDAITKVEGKKQSHRPGLYHCNGCEKQFTVTVGTVYESSHVPLHKWLLATHLMTASKKGISAHQIHRMLGITYKSAWFMAHRIREGMREFNPPPMGGEGKTIEADETYYGPGVRRAGSRKKRQGTAGKSKIVALVERGGPVRSFKVDHADAKTIRKVLVENASRKSKLMTDEAGMYASVGLEFERHGTVMHSAEEWVRRDDRLVHTNTIEGFFSIFKRGMRGIYQHCGEQHLQRYLDEFGFRYSNRIALGIDDQQRALKALRGIEGKRLTYRRIDGQART
ncbi:MAG TPA: IS1595 family transposase [Stellaceae bacterium]|nr:IS1595 family transposase [Stellaceae bacterium]